MTNSTKQHAIKAITNFRTMTADAVVTASVNIQGTVYNNPNFAGAPPQPVDQPTLKAATDSLVAANAAAVDGGKKAIQQQKHQKEVVVKFLVQRIGVLKALRQISRRPVSARNVTVLVIM